MRNNVAPVRPGMVRVSVQEKAAIREIVTAREEEKIKTQVDRGACLDSAWQALGCHLRGALLASRLPERAHFGPRFFIECAKSVQNGAISALILPQTFTKTNIVNEYRGPPPSIAPHVFCRSAPVFKSRVFAFVLMTVAAASAHAVTVDFEGLGQTGGFKNFDHSGFSDQGFDFDLSHGHIIDNEFWYMNNYASTNGTDWLMHDDAGGDLTVSAGGSLFSLTSVDAGQYKNKKNSDDIQVTGYLENGSTVSQTISSKSGFQTNVFTGWTNLLEVTFSGNGYGTYDNFVLSTVTTTAVPVPTPILMLTSAMGLLGIAGFRRKSKTA